MKAINGNDRKRRVISQDGPPIKKRRLTDDEDEPMDWSENPVDTLTEQFNKMKIRNLFLFAEAASPKGISDTTVLKNDHIPYVATSPNSQRGHDALVSRFSYRISPKGGPQKDK